MAVATLASEIYLNREITQKKPPKKPFINIRT